MHAHLLFHSWRRMILVQVFSHHRLCQPVSMKLLWCSDESFLISIQRKLHMLFVSSAHDSAQKLDLRNYSNCFNYLGGQQLNLATLGVPQCPTIEWLRYIFLNHNWVITESRQNDGGVVSHNYCGKTNMPIKIKPMREDMWYLNLYSSTLGNRYYSYFSKKVQKR